MTLQTIMGLIMGGSIYAGVWAIDSHKSEGTKHVTQGIMIGVGIVSFVLSVYFEWDN